MPNNPTNSVAYLLIVLFVGWLSCLPACAQADAFDTCASCCPFGHAYDEDLTKKIGKSWRPAAGDWSEIVLVLTLAADGKILQLQMKKSSGTATLDRDALAAVRAGAPFSKLPAGLSKGKFELHFKPLEKMDATAPPADGMPLTRSLTEGIPVDPSRDIDFGPYMGSLQKRVRAGWQPRCRPDPKLVFVEFVVDKKGIVNGARVTRSCGDKAVDAAALLAVKKAKLPPLPAGAPPSVSIQYTFEQGGYLGMKKSGDSWVVDIIYPEQASPGRNSKS